MSQELIRLLAGAGSFFGAWIIADQVRRHAVRLQLLQFPNERSSHVVPTPSGGGVGIAVAGTVAGTLFMQHLDLQLAWAIGVSAIAALIGFLDDRHDLSPKLRIVVHFAIVGVLLQTLPHSDPTPTPFGNIAYPVAFAAVLVAGVWWINLFNFMDGIDGLAAGQAIFMLGGMVTLASSSGSASLPSVTWMIAIAAACSGFLVLNWSPARVFMGDVGSNYLAVSVLALGLHLVATGVIAYAVLPILAAGFCTDATITLVRRVAAGERWLSAHRVHAYQKLARRWGSHRPATMLYLAINVLWLYPLAYLATAWPEGSLLAIAGAVTPFVWLCWWVGAGVPEPHTTN